MRLFVLCLLVLCASLSETKDLTVGTKVNNLLIKTEKFVVGSIPFIRREKSYEYTDSKQRIIKGIIVRDLLRSKIEPKVTAGGVGHTDVTIEFRSERGEGINYIILIFSDKF